MNDKMFWYEDKIIVDYNVIHSRQMQNLVYLVVNNVQ